MLCEVGTRLVQVAAHPQGSDIAIADAYRIMQGKRIGVAPVRGPPNGLQRPAPGSKPTALIRGQRVPIVAVSLEHLTLDLDEVADAEAGDELLLLGGDGPGRIGLEDLAEWSRTVLSGYGSGALRASLAHSTGATLRKGCARWHRRNMW